MTWGYVDASFDGIPFHIKRSTTKGGPRTVDHVYPRSDRTDVEQLGGVSGKFILDAFLFGPDYPAEARRFEAALNKLGTHVLVHSYRGTFDVKVDGEFSAVEETGNGGMLHYSIPFAIQKPISSVAVVSVDTIWLAQVSKADLLSAAQEDFLSIFDLAQKPAAMVADVGAAMDKGLSAIDSAKRIAASTAAFKREVGNIRGRIIALGLNIEYLTGAFVGLVDWGVDAAADARECFRELREIMSFSDTLVSGRAVAGDAGYPARQFQTLLKLAAVAGEVGLATSMEFTSAADVREIQAEIFQTFEDVSRLPVSDDTFKAMQDARSAVFQHLSDYVTRLPGVVQLELRNQTNTLELVYSLYGDLAEEQAFIRRNGIVHPGFVPANVPLEVVVRDA